MASRKRLKHFTRHGDSHRIREELLRPSPYLGYDHDQLGRYFLQREAHELAESEFRRAVWLNPYEPMFRVHHAQALLRFGRMNEARDLLIELRNDGRARNVVSELLQHYWPDES